MDDPVARHFLEQSQYHHGNGRKDPLFERLVVSGTIAPEMTRVFSV
jgi:hypothetical protein